MEIITAQVLFFRLRTVGCIGFVYFWPWPLDPTKQLRLRFILLYSTPESSI